eukprot:TRINITY_DN7889_c1_g1_i7.p1 TRINITY_DN7889_c1_g1~~TRINITY_DN7889_c1_g1_i7.p1  ORF type:complete len:249 (-),score=-13.47 TRINITY_DN7889_c1_g1_i7:28-774(-)
MSLSLQLQQIAFLNENFFCYLHASKIIYTVCPDFIYSVVQFLTCLRSIQFHTLNFVHHVILLILYDFWDFLGVLGFCFFLRNAWVDDVIDSLQVEIFFLIIRLALLVPTLIFFLNSAQFKLFDIQLFVQKPIDMQSTIKRTNYFFLQVVIYSWGISMRLSYLPLNYIQVSKYFQQIFFKPLIKFWVSYPFFKDRFILLYLSIILACSEFFYSSATMLVKSLVFNQVFFKIWLNLIQGGLLPKISQQLF